MFRRTFLKLSLAAANASIGRSGNALFSPAAELDGPVCVGLTCEYETEPLAIETKCPRLGWKLAAPVQTRRGLRQESYHVIVASSLQRLDNSQGDLWDSGVVRTDQSVQVPYGGKNLDSEQRCFWKVRVRDERGVWSAWSDGASWTMGLLFKTDWTGSWIGYPEATSTAGARRDPWMRKRLTLSTKPERCLMHVASIGFHELYVNGVKVGDRVLAPSVSNLKHRVRYVTYDITEALHAGENVLGLWLGTSWSIFPAYRTDDRPEQPLVKLQGSVRFADGIFQRIVSDSSWKTLPSPNSLIGTWKVHDYGGERYDAREELPNWATAELDDSTWCPVQAFELSRELSADASAGNVLAHAIVPVGISASSEGVYRIDMGVNFAGWFQMDVEGAPGNEVRFQISENEHETCTYAQRSAYVIGPTGKGTFRNRFNYMCGRWITVEGVSKAPDLASVYGWNVRSPFARLSGFSCDQPLLNKIYDTTLWTFENLALGSYIVDCPHRERTGYGDAEEVLRTSINNYALGSFLSQWAEDWRDVQGPDGDIPHSAPTEVGGGGPAWGAFSITLPWRLYQRYGDRRALRDGFPTMQRWLAFLETHAEGDMLRRWGGKWGFFGDWQWPKFSIERAEMERQGKGLGDTAEALFFNNCYWVHALRTTALVAETIGENEVAAKYRARAESIRQKVHTAFFRAAESSYVNGYPAYLAIALRAEIPPSELRHAVWKRLEREIMDKRSGHIWAGIIGGVVLVDLLLDHRRDDLIYAMASKTDFPSWGDILNAGHTTFTEGWGGSGSGLHSSFLYVGSWFTEGLAGIRQPMEGFRSFEIDPSIDLQGGPNQASARIDTEYGRIASSWRRDGQTISLQATIPPNTTCHLRLRDCLRETLREDGKPISRAAGIQLAAHAADCTLLALQPGTYAFAFQTYQV